MQKQGHIYILYSIKFNKYYVGSTTDLNRRLKEHNSGNVNSTKHWRPYKLVFSQCFDTIESARIIETKLKSWKRRDYLEKIIKDGYLKIK